MSGRVLVVDDIEANVKLLKAKLSSEYFDVLTAYNGPTALEIAQTELPDVILLDVMMPRMDGFEVCRQLKANRRTIDVPVVMVTALSDTANRLRGLSTTLSPHCSERLEFPLPDGTGDTLLARLDRPVASKPPRAQSPGSLTTEDPLHKRIGHRIARRQARDQQPARRARAL